MSIVSRKVKKGRPYSQYGCSARHHKGASVCSNGLTIGETRLIEAVVAALRDYFASPAYEAWLEEAYAANQRARAQAASRDDEVARLQTDVRAAEARIEKVTDAIARIGYSEPLEAKLRAEEAKLLDARAALARAAAAASPAPLPRAFFARAALAVIDHIAKKTNPAAQVDGGVGDSENSCGGPHSRFASPFRPAMFRRIVGSTRARGGGAGRSEPLGVRPDDGPVGRDKAA